MKIFAIDSPLMNILSKIADLLILNLITLVMCIPIVTAGASFTAMHYCCLKLARGHETSMWKQFFHSFKDNFKQSTLIWLLFLVIMGFIGYDFVLMYNNPTELSSFVFGGLLVFTIILLFGGSMVFPVQAKFYNTIPVTIKTGFIFSFRHFFKTLVFFVLKLLPLVLMLLGNIGIMVFPLILCFCFSAPGFVAAKLYDKSFQEAEDIIFAKEAAEKGSTDEEEKIFTDVPEKTS
ncbi:MAG: YesL family protein [Lachnospiraceae bacterium]|nr:YesL family protein [Lachnospiraceae bacterium]